MESPYLLVTAPCETLEGLVEGDNFGAGDLVATQDIGLERSDGGSGYIVGGDPGDGSPLAPGDEGYRSL